MTQGIFQTHSENKPQKFMDIRHKMSYSTPRPQYHYYNVIFSIFIIIKPAGFQRWGMSPSGEKIGPAPPPLRQSPPHVNSITHPHLSKSVGKP